MTSPAIATRDLTRWYGATRGIEGLDLAVEPGEVFGFLGPNGAGKTTTIRLLLDLIRPTRGTATICGHDCRREGLAARRRVGYLPAEYGLYDNQNGRELLAYLGSLRGGMAPAEIEAKAAQLGAELERPLRTLSHGNKQKIALLTAFAPRPEVLILDEPTSGLDPLVRRVFQEMVAEVHAEGRTVFLSSHDLAEVEKMCDRVASVRAGRLIDVSGVAEIRSRALRLVELVCEREPAVDTFAKVPGLSDPRLEGCRLRCRLQGSPAALLAAAAPYGVADILSREPSLEELFLTLYGDEEEAR